MNAAHDLAEFCLYVLYICTFVLLLVGLLYLLWRGLLRPTHSFLVEKGYLQPLVDRASAPREHSVTRRWPYFIGIGIVSVLLAILELSLTKMNTPGWWAMSKICAAPNPQGSPCDLTVITLLPIVLDASMVFLILWGAYSAWLSTRD